MIFTYLDNVKTNWFSVTNTLLTFIYKNHVYPFLLPEKAANAVKLIPCIRPSNRARIEKNLVFMFYVFTDK